MKYARCSIAIATWLAASTPAMLVDCGDPSGTAPSGSAGAGGGASALPECSPPATEASLLADAKQIMSDVEVDRKSVWKSIFGLADDGSIDPNGLDAIDWDPSHDSVSFTSLDVERIVPLFISNDAAKVPTSANVTLGVAADTGTNKYALLGANVPSDLAKDPPAHFREKP